MTLANALPEVAQTKSLTNVTAILSMLHEPADRNSATRRFRQDPVLAWTLDRLTRSQRVGTIAILCWDDQIEAVHSIAEEHHAHRARLVVGEEGGDAGTKNPVGHRVEDGSGQTANCSFQCNGELSAVS